MTIAPAISLPSDLSHAHDGTLGEAPARGGHRPLNTWRRLILPMGVALVIGQFVLISLFAFSWRGAELRQAEGSLQDSVTGLSEHAAQSLNTIDAVLDSFVERALSEGTAWFDGYDETIAARLMDEIANIPHIRGFLTITPAGLLANDYAVRGSRVMDLSDRRYFAVHRDNPEHGLFLSEPMMSRSQGTWFLSASRAVVDDDGEFLGVIAVSVEPMYFSSFYAGLGDSSIDRAIVQGDGTILSAQSENGGSDAGSLIGQAITLPDGLAGSGTSYRGPGLMSADTSLIRVARVPGWDWLIVAEMPVSVALAHWYEEMWVLGTVGALSVLTIVGALAWIGRHHGLLRQAYETISKQKVDLEVQNLRLKESNRSLEEFTYAASHDLQEPLRKIEAFSDCLSSHCGGCLNEGGTDFVTRIRKASTRMRTLIEDLLALSRINTEELDFKPTDLAETFADALHDLEIVAAQSGAHVQIDNALPVVDGDARMLRQLAQNLLSNALKFGRPDVQSQISVTAEIGTRDDGTAVCRVMVCDNGVGFEQRFAERIMRPFQRLNGRSAFKGTGIGLAICTRVVERHGGTLSATGVPDEGATFTAALPLRQRQRPIANSITREDP